MADMVVTLKRDTTTFTFIPVPRIDEKLQKKLRSKKVLEGADAVVQDHLQEDHIFVLTYTAVTDKPAGSGTAWAKKRNLIEAMKNTGKTWKLNLKDTDRGFDETHYVVCDSIVCNDMAGEEESVHMIITFKKTQNWEGIS